MSNLNLLSIATEKFETSYSDFKQLKCELFKKASEELFKELNLENTSTYIKNIFYFNAIKDLQSKFYSNPPKDKIYDVVGKDGRFFGIFSNPNKAEKYAKETLGEAHEVIINEKTPEFKQIMKDKPKEIDNFVLFAKLNTKQIEIYKDKYSKFLKSQMISMVTNEEFQANGITLGLILKQQVPKQEDTNIANKFFTDIKKILLTNSRNDILYMVNDYKKGDFFGYYTEKYVASEIGKLTGTPVQEVFLNRETPAYKQMQLAGMLNEKKPVLVYIPSKSLSPEDQYQAYMAGEINSNGYISKKRKIN